MVVRSSGKDVATAVKVSPNTPVDIPVNKDSFSVDVTMKYPPVIIPATDISSNINFPTVNFIF
jgi:hypothetical protein